MVEHLGYFHGKVQALCCLPAEVADGPVTQATLSVHTLTQVTVLGDVQKRLQTRGLAAAHGGAERPNPAVATSEGGQQTVQRLTEETGQENRSTKVSERRSDTAVQC